jgi:hypothetical protein
MADKRQKRNQNSTNTMNSIYEHAEEPTPPKPDYDPAMDLDEIQGMEQLIDNADALIRAAAYVMQIEPEDITSKRRTFAVSLARKIVMTLWAESHSLQDASRIIGKTNHTNAHYARRTIHEKLLHCHKTRERVRKILQKYSEIILAESNKNTEDNSSASF